jgi:hypothetical protein
MITKILLPEEQKAIKETLNEFELMGYSIDSISGDPELMGKFWQRVAQKLKKGFQAVGKGIKKGVQRIKDRIKYREGSYTPPSLEIQEKPQQERSPGYSPGYSPAYTQDIPQKAEQQAEKDIQQLEQQQPDNSKMLLYGGLAIGALLLLTRRK